MGNQREGEGKSFTLGEPVHGESSSCDGLEDKEEEGWRREGADLME